MSKREPYTSGYMKPPKHAQFKKGKSGNPKGRPRKPPDTFKVLQKILKRKVSIVGQDEKITVFDALVQKLRERALSGDVQAIALTEQIFEMNNKLSPPANDHQQKLASVKRRLALLMGWQEDEDGNLVHPEEDAGHDGQ